MSLELIIRIALTIALLLIPGVMLIKRLFRGAKIIHKQYKQIKKEKNEKKKQEQQRKKIVIEQARIEQERIEQERIEEKAQENKQTKEITIIIEDKNENQETITSKNEKQEKTTSETADKSLEKKQPLITVFAKEDEKKIEQIKSAAIRIKQRDPKGYEKKLIEGLAEFPQSIELMSLLADYYIEVENYKKASTLLKTIISQDEENHRALRELAEIYIKEGERQNAQIMLEKAIRLQKNNPKYLYSMVDIQYNSGNIDDALFLMEKILKLRPISSEYLIATAMLYEEKGEIQTAKRYYFEVLEHEPDNRTAKIKLKNM